MSTLIETLVNTYTVIFITRALARKEQKRCLSLVEDHRYILWEDMVGGELTTVFDNCSDLVDTITITPTFNQPQRIYPT